ncbi:MAG: mechanosensitive ion channel family protein [Cetobacterium sp.]|uniref:mechanosensitive ion channel family protein n=1 Tax=Cetobacterium sp. TaxID=2071632 RepID=UPI003F36C5B0
MMEFLASAKESFMTALPGLAIRLVVLIIIFSCAKPVLNGILRVTRVALRKNKVEPLLETFTISLVKTLYYIAALFIVVSTIGIQATSLVTVLGTAGIAVGLALQGSLSNLAGGILILMFKQFSKGDYISNNGGIEGTVDEIHILYTTLNTPDNKRIVIPNGQLANNAIINFSKNPERRVDLMFSVSYDTPMEKVEKILKDIMDKNPKILHDHNNMIKMFKHNASSIDYIFRAWVKKEDYWDVYFECMSEVKRVFDENHIEIPYQKIDIYTKK